jgi:hypothetical protein
MGSGSSKKKKAEAAAKASANIGGFTNIPERETQSLA